MATETPKPNDTKLSQDALRETLKQNVSLTAKPVQTEDPSCDSSSALLTDDSGTEKPKIDGEDSKATEAVEGSAPTNSSLTASDIEKKIRRAERFGISVQLTEEEKRNSRAERFQTGSVESTVHGSESGKGAGKGAEEIKRKARAERFGLASLSVPSEEEAKKKARTARFAPTSSADPLEEEKRKARSARFASTLSSSTSEVNGKGNIEQEATIAGKAGGGT